MFSAATCCGAPNGSVVLDRNETGLEKGDLFVVPSWAPWSLRAETQFDLFRFSDAPVIERLGFARTLVEGSEEKRP